MQQPTCGLAIVGGPEPQAGSRPAKHTNPGKDAPATPDAERGAASSAATRRPIGRGHLPWVLLILWVANVSSFLYYFARFGLPDLQK